ncbi:lipopolysaccharide assembly protein LapA domain-containing protein [Thermodesulfobacteriota bacterium]
MEQMKKKLPMKPKYIALLVIIVLFLIFLIQNTQVVTLHLYFWKISMHKIILIPLCILIGFLLGYFGPTLLKKDKTLRK